MMATARELGGTLGVAVVATVAIAGAEDALGGPGAAPGAGALALTEGFHRASLVAAAFSLVAAVGAGLLLLRAQSRPATT